MLQFKKSILMIIVLKVYSYYIHYTYIYHMNYVRYINLGRHGIELNIV